MEAILEKKNWPKFLKVNGTPEKKDIKQISIKAMEER